MKKDFFKGLIVGIIITIGLNHSIFAEGLNKLISVYPNYINLVVNNQKVKNENFLYNGIVYVPLREFAELLDTKVDWIQETKTVNVYKTNDENINKQKSSNSNDGFDKYKIEGKSVFKGYFQNVDYSDPNVFISSGEQSKLTSEINNIAKSFNDNKDLSTIMEIYQWMSRNLRLIEGEKFGRTSHDILTSKGVTGCTDYGLAFIALTRAKEIPTVFVQTARVDWIKERQESNNGMITGHILAEVYIDVNNDGKKEWCLVDSTSGRLYLDYNKDNFSLSEGYYVFAKSLEVWDSGAKNEQENHMVMMELFKDFDLSLYNNPKYEYINLMDGRKGKTGEFMADSTVIGNSAQIIGEKEPVELFNSMFTNGFINKDMVSFSLVNKGKLTSTQRIIALYSFDMKNKIPDFVKELVPEIENSREEYVMNKVRDGRRIILVKAKTINRLMEMIENLPSDFLDSDY